MNKFWSSTQSTIALPSGEADFYGLARGTSLGIGVIGHMQDLGMNFRVMTNTDLSEALGISKRRGLGKVSHIELNQLWIQDKVISGEIEVREVKGEYNRADALTKYVDQEHIGHHMDWTGQGVQSGRHQLAPACHCHKRHVKHEK